MCRVSVALSLRQWGLSLMRSKSVFITSVKAAVLTPAPKPGRRAAASALLQPGDNLRNRPQYTAWCTEGVDRMVSEISSHATWSQAPGIIWSQLLWVLNYGYFQQVWRYSRWRGALQKSQWDFTVRRYCSTWIFFYWVCRKKLINT